MKLVEGKMDRGHFFGRGGYRALSPRCARVGYFRAASPDGRGDRGDYRVPIKRTAQVLTQSQSSDTELNKCMCHTDNARVPSLMRLPCGCMLPRWGGGGVQGGSRES